MSNPGQKEKFDPSEEYCRWALFEHILNLKHPSLHLKQNKYDSQGGPTKDSRLQLHSMNLSKYEVCLHYVYKYNQDPVISGEKLNEDYMKKYDSKKVI